ncbi:MAG: tripartite tricarboxylate transporter substrate binding protein, partial [Pseudomonadota bacterium]|nr:tripartite tricarboxylate transporter substrate binding protein [Pseudomonadota bacterium]
MMKSSMKRRNLVLSLPMLALLNACGGGTESSSAGGSGNFPSRPFRIIVPFGAGGLADVTIR